MTRRLLQLNGLAILAIVLHHAAAYTLQAMFQWTDRYRAVTVPNYDLLGSWEYYLMMVIRLLLIWSVPAFLFISGYYAGFMSRGNQSTLKWNSMLPRVKVLMYPFIIWTIIRYLLLRHIPTSIDELLDPYHFVPVLIQFYLLAPWIVRLAQRHWKLLLGVAIVIHLSILGLRYLGAIGISFPGQETFMTLTPRWFFLSGQPFWFPFGIVFGIHFYNRQQQLTRLKWVLLTAAILFGAMIIAEYELVNRIRGQWIGPVFNSVASVPFSLAVILCYLSFSDRSLPLSPTWSHMGSRSLGIYMANIPFIYVIALLMYHLTPWLLGYHLIYYLILAIVGMGGPLLFMEVIRTAPTPARIQYRYLFG